MAANRGTPPDRLQKAGAPSFLSPMESFRVTRRENGVVTISLQRPEKKNAINYPMWGALAAAIDEVAASKTDRVLVLTGSEDSFCAGADLAGEMDADRHQLSRMHYINKLPLALYECPKPTIAKVNGIAAGAGVNLAIGCDLVVASDRARFSEIFVKRGLTVDLGGTWLLPRQIGIHRAKELALFGDMISAAEADRIGLVNRVVPHDELDAFVDDWANRLAEGPPLAMQMSKQLLNAGLSSSLHEALNAEAMAQSVNFASEDTPAAIAAFFRKTTAKFRGL
jgi:2-(1,2-epoxy-1,2-dihydrophenyl)acetyl-CoA isomerase